MSYLSGPFHCSVCDVRLILLSYIQDQVRIVNGKTGQAWRNKSNNRLFLSIVEMDSDGWWLVSPRLVNRDFLCSNMDKQGAWTRTVCSCLMVAGIGTLMTSGLFLSDQQAWTLFASDPRKGSSAYGMEWGFNHHQGDTLFMVIYNCSWQTTYFFLRLAYAPVLV